MNKNMRVFVMAVMLICTMILTLIFLISVASGPDKIVLNLNRYGEAIFEFEILLLASVFGVVIFKEELDRYYEDE